MSEEEFLDKFKGWKVYNYFPEDHNGALFCPKCREIVKSASGGLLPPWVCNKDKTFFDPALSYSFIENKVQLHGGFYSGNLQHLFRKYATIIKLRQKA